MTRRERNGATAALQMVNPPTGKPTELIARWTNNLLSSLRPGGVWVVPRSVSTVVVIQHDPKEVELHCIFPDPRLAIALIAAGWAVRHRPKHKES